MSGTLEFVTREDLPEAIVIAVTARRIVEGAPEFEALPTALAALPDGSQRPAILDMTKLEFLSSACLGLLITAWRRLAADRRPLPPPRPAHKIWSFYPDRPAALAVARRGECDPLVLCGVRPDIREIFL